MLLFTKRQEEAEQKIQEFKEILKQAEKEEQKNIHTIQSKYEKQLLLEKEAKARLKEDGGVMTQKVTKDPKHLLLSSKGLKHLLLFVVTDLQSPDAD